MEPETDLSLEKVQARFTQWRQSRATRGIIPPELWRDAASLSPRYSACRIARELGLGIYSVKSKIATLDAESSDPAFVELKWDSLSSEGRPVGEYKIEIRKADGARLTIDCSSDQPVSIDALISAFLT